MSFMLVFGLDVIYAGFRLMQFVLVFRLDVIYAGF